MAELRVLHAADLHVDSPMRGLVAYDGAPVDEIRSATRTALRALVAEAIERRVHLVLLAGDLYDGSWRDYNTGLFVVSQLAELHDAGIPVVIVYGNHDAESQLTKNLRLPPNTKVLASDKPESHVFADLGIAVHGQSYATRAIDADLSLAYPSADPGLVNIGMLHTCFNGSLGHEPYAPCTIAGLRSRRYDYWALGHVHEHAIVCEEPMAVFPGNLQGRHVRETGPKGATLVTFVDHEPNIEQLTFDIVRWERCRVDLTEADSLDECLARCREGLLGVSGTGATTYAIRVELVGSTTVNSLLRSKSEQVTNEVRALSLALDGTDVWIEKVAVATTPPTGRPTLEGDGAAGEISRVLADLKGDISTLVAIEGSPIPSLAALRSQLRAASGSDLGDVPDDADIVAALDDAAELLATLLRAEVSEHAN